MPYPALIALFVGALFSAVGNHFIYFGSEKDAPVVDREQGSARSDGAEVPTHSSATSRDAGPEAATASEEPAGAVSSLRSSSRDIRITDGTTHSIPLDEILAGGPPKDGIPSIDSPQFISADAAQAWLEDDAIGLGLALEGAARFYPYQILVWHEIVNEQFPAEEGAIPLAVTYCPLCQTGVVYDRRVDSEVMEFGVSGLLWQSNLLMYNREEREAEESLWSQVLGEAVVGPDTGTKLAIVRADTVRFGDWRTKHPDTLVLSRDTGAARDYGVDPYGEYYTDNAAVFFPISNRDDARLAAKDFVLGIEIDGQFKAYPVETLSEGVTTDRFASETITIEKSAIGEISMLVGEGSERARLPYIGGFWFSWVAVHPETEVYP